MELDGHETVLCMTDDCRSIGTEDNWESISIGTPEEVKMVKKVARRGAGEMGEGESH